MTLKERLDQRNQESKEFMAANPGSWSSRLTDDLDHWAGYGITTAEQLEAYLGPAYLGPARPGSEVVE